VFGLAILASPGTGALLSLLGTLLLLEGWKGFREVTAPMRYLARGRTRDLVRAARRAGAGARPGRRRDSFRTWEGLGWVSLGELAEARAALAPVREERLSPILRAYHRTALSALALRAGDTTKALEIVKDPGGLDSWFPGASRVNRLNLELCHVRVLGHLGRFDEAVDRLQVMRSGAPAGNARTILSVEIAYATAMGSGRIGQALGYASRSMELPGPHDGRRPVLGLCLQLASLNPERSLALLSEPWETEDRGPLSIDPVREAVFALAHAEALRRMGRPEDAAEAEGAVKGPLAARARSLLAQAGARRSDLLPEPPAPLV
jgi:hypothetical protein